MKFKQLSFNGDPNLGLYGFATDRYAVIGKGIDMPDIGVPSIEVSHQGSSFSGIFFTGNSSFVIGPSDMEPETEAAFLRHANIIKIRSKFNAIGNLVLLNDRACLISPLIRKEKQHLQDLLDIECEVRDIGGVNLVGSVALLTNSGLMTHHGVSDEELDFLEDFFGVRAGVGTLNSGSMFIGSSAIANSGAMLLSDACTGIEMARASEIFEGG